MKRKDKPFWESVKHNDDAFKHYYWQLLDIAISCFKWSGLPETIDPRFMELTIMTDPLCFYCIESVFSGYFFLTSSLFSAIR